MEIVILTTFAPIITKALAMIRVNFQQKAIDMQTVLLKRNGEQMSLMIMLTKVDACFQ